MQCSGIDRTRVPLLAAALVSSLAIASLATTSPASAQPEMRGALAVEEWDAGAISAAGAFIRTRVVYPSDATEPGPVVAVVHGYLRNGSYMMELARVLASRGMVAIVPDMPCGLGGCDHDANARQVSALLAWAITQSGTSGSRIAGLVDPERRGAIGHSWGGLGTFLAVAGDPSIDVWVGLDPQEDGSDALTAAPDVAIPNLHLMAAVDGNCNGEWTPAVASSTTAARLRMTIASSGHCDPEEPTDAACDFACIAGDRATTPTFRRYTVAFVACVLGVDPSMAEWIGGASFDADVASGRLTGVMPSDLDTIDCGAPPITPVDAGPITDADAGALPDVDAASPTADAATPGTDASTTRSDAGSGTEPSADAGCGCRAASPSRASPLGLVTALAIGLLVRRRRR